MLNVGRTQSGKLHEEQRHQRKITSQLRSNSTQIKHSPLSVVAKNNENILLLLNEINQNLDIFLNQSPHNVGSFEKIYQKISKISSHKDYNLLVNVYLTEKSSEMYQKFQSLIENDSSINNIALQIHQISRSVLFFSYVFASWSYSNMTVQKKVCLEFNTHFRSNTLFMEKIFQETNNYIDTLRISQEKETKLQWIIDFIIKIGLEKEFLQSFEENSKNFLFRNPITDYQSTTIISQVDEIISNNKSIFQSINSSFLEKIDNLYRSLAYNTFIVSELSTIFDNAFDLQDKNAFKTITNFINSSNIEGLVDKYKNLWISRLSTYLNSLFSMTNNSCIPKLISVYNFIKSFNDEIPSGLQGDLLLLLQRFLNDSNTFGIYMIARYIHNIIVTEEVTDQKMKDVVSILSLFDDTDQFSQFYHHFLCNRLLRYFTPPPAIEKNSVISFSPFIEESIMKQINRMMDEMENVEIFEHSSEMNIKFIAVTSGLWIVPLSKQLFVPPEVEIARESYRKHYKEKFPKRALNFTPLVDHVTFKYKGVSWSGFYPYLAVLMAISEDKNIFEIGLTQKCIPEVVNALLKLGLIQRMAGKYILASNFKPQRKLNKLPQLSIFLPQVPRKLDHKELFSKKKPKLEFLITRTMKNYEGVSADELYQQIANTSQFSIHRKEFDCCIASLIATEQITMDCNQKLHYNPF